MWRSLLAGTALAFATLCHAQPQAGADARLGWHFHEDPPPPPPPEKKAAPEPVPTAPAITALPAVPAVRPEVVEFEKVQKRLQELRTVAIMVPTEANVRQFMEYERMVVAKASLFADVARRVSWTVPELDPSFGGRPMNAAALRVFESEEKTGRLQRFDQLSKTHVLLFFYRSNCPYCHKFAPTVAAFSKRYGVKVEAISVDGPGLPEFPNPRPDNGIAARLGVKQVPALYLAQPYKGTIATVGFGVMSMPTLEERISAVADPASDPSLRVTQLKPSP